MPIAARTRWRARLAALTSRRSGRLRRYEPRPRASAHTPLVVALRIHPMLRQAVTTRRGWRHRWRARAPPAPVRPGHRPRQAGRRPSAGWRSTPPTLLRMHRRRYALALRSLGRGAPDRVLRGRPPQRRRSARGRSPCRRTTPRLPSPEARRRSRAPSRARGRHSSTSRGLPRRPRSSPAPDRDRRP